MTYPAVNFVARKAALQQQISELSAELAFTSGETPVMDKFMTNREQVAGECADHGGFTGYRIWVEKHGRLAERFSKCPACCRTRLADAVAEQKSMQTDRLMQNAQISPRFAGCEFSTYQPVNRQAADNLATLKAYAAVWPNVAERGVSLILTGKPGTGKNHLAVSLAKQLIREHEAEVLLTSVMRIIRAVRSTWSRDSDMTEDEVIDHYTSRDLLIIDEVGVQAGSDSEKNILFEIINGRYEQMMPTVLISNLPLHEIAQVVGERLTDRMAEEDGAVLVFDWESFRGQKGRGAE